MIRSAALLIALLLAAPAWAVHYGERAVGSTVRWRFSTVGPGGATTLSGGPVVSIYKDASTTESTAGVTLTPDTDTRMGASLLVVDTSADGTFYSSGSCFDAMITTGTVGGVSFVGYVVGSFCLGSGSAPSAATIAGAVVDQALSGHTTAGTVGEALSRMDVVLSTRAAAASTIVIQLPVGESGKLTIKQGDDYSASDAAPIDFEYENASYDPSSPTSLTLRIYSGSTEVAAYTGTVLGSSPTYTLRFQPTAAQTGALVAGDGYRYDIEVVKSSRKRTLAEDDCEVLVN